MRFPLQKGLSETWWEQLTRVVRDQEHLLLEEVDYGSTAWKQVIEGGGLQLSLSHLHHEEHD